jgi:hypothetical protein
MTTREDTIDELCGLPGDGLRERMRRGHPIDPAALADTEYRGISLGLPRWLEQLTWKTFMKVFHRDEHRGVLRGWNVRLEQTGIFGPCVPRQKGGRRVTFGHYEVLPASGYRVPHGLDQGVMLDYGLGRNGRLAPLSRARDPVVALEPGGVALLLGWTYLDLGLRLLPTPSYFLLERHGPLGEVVGPPRP